MATISAIAICNMALSHLGTTTGLIESLTQQSSTARQCNLWYDICRQQVLEAQDWSFARKRQALALHSEDAPDQWTFRYQLPSDCLAARLIWNPSGQNSVAIPFELEVSSTNEDVTVLTDLDDALLIYTRDVTLPQMFSPLFVNALSHYLAAKLAYGMTGKFNIEQKEMQAFERALQSAAASNANQGVAGLPRDADWILGR